MSSSEIIQNRQQRFRIANFLVSVGVIRTLLYQHFGVFGFEIFVKQGDVTDNAKTVGEYPSLLRVAEMAIDILLLNGGVDDGMVRKKTVNCLVWVHLRVRLGKGLCLIQL